MAYQPVHGNPPSGQKQYPPDIGFVNASYPTAANPPPYPTTDNPPPYLTQSNRSYNPTYAPSQGGYPSSAPPPLNAPYLNPPPPVQYPGMSPQQTANVVALNSVPNTNRSWGGSYGPGWYNYSSTNRKKAFMIFGIFAGVIIAVFIIVFVTMTVKSQREFDAFHKKHFGD